MENIEKRLENIALGLSVPVERLKLIAYQIKAKDRMDGDDLLQLCELGVPFIRAVMDFSTETYQSVNDMVKKGQINFTIFRMVVNNLTDEGGMFYNLKEKEMNYTVDCRSEEGITIGLIDSLISIARVLSKRDLEATDLVKEALKDLRNDEDVTLLVKNSENLDDYNFTTFIKTMCGKTITIERNKQYKWTSINSIEKE